MSNVQKENGFTPIANELMEVVSKEKFNGTQYKIILAIWRNTYGFQRKSHQMSLGYLAEATGVHKQTLKRELEKLIERKVIKVVKNSTYTSPRILQFNKDYSKWIGLQSTDEHTVSQKDNSTVSQLAHSTVSQGAYSTVSQLAYQQRKSKERTKETTKERESAVDPISFYSENFGIVSPYMVEKIEYWIEDTSSELVVKAMKVALENGVRKLKYVEGILKDWKSKNYTTPKDLIEETNRGEKPKTKKELIRDELEEIKETLNLGEDYFQAVGNPGRYSELVKRRDELNEQLRVN